MTEKTDANKYFSRIATVFMATAMFIGIYTGCDTNDENQKPKTYSKSKQLDLDNYDPEERCIKIKGQYKDGTCYGHFKNSWKDGLVPFAETYFGACKDVKITTDGDSARFEGICGKKGMKVVISADHAAKTCAEKCPKCPEVTLTARGDCLHTTNEEARKDICLNSYNGDKYESELCYVQIETPVDIEKAQSIFDDKFGGCSTHGVSAPDRDGYATWRGLCGSPFINMNIKFKVKNEEKAGEIKAKETVQPVQEEKNMTIYDFTVKDRKGNDVPMANFKGKVLLIVNTATGCGFTPQYEGLEKLWEEYHNKGLEILDFPCDQFGHQAPGTDEEIHQFCQVKFNTGFENFKKIEVNGENAEPLYKYLKSKKSFAGFTGEKAEFMAGFIAKQDPDYKNNAEIKWNFTKFLVNREGDVLERFESTVEPAEIADKIKGLL